MNRARKNHPKMSLPGENNTARQGKSNDTVARRQPRGYAVDNWKILEEKMLQTKRLAACKGRYSRGGQELPPPPKRELEMLCSASSESTNKKPIEWGIWVQKESKTIFDGREDEQKMENDKRLVGRERQKMVARVGVAP